MEEAGFKAKADAGDTCSLCVWGGSHCIYLCVSMRGRICHRTSDNTQIFITVVTANPCVCAASSFPSFSQVSPVKSASLTEGKLSPGKVKCEGVIFTTFYLSIHTSSLRQPECFQMSTLYCSINTISLPPAPTLPRMLSKLCQ